MFSKRVKVAIGMPVYNGSAYLRQALDSLLSQSYRDFHLIISDNGSTDGTAEICREYARRDHRIRYVRQPSNLGAVPNFNWVFEAANSEYFKWAAADDVCAPTYLEKAVRQLDANPDAVWCHARSSHIDQEGALLDESGSQDVSYARRSDQTASVRFAAVLLDNNGCLDSYGLIRSEAIRKTPLYLPYYGPEKVFIAELALLGRYVEIPETLFFARVTAGGSGAIASAEDQQSFIDTRKARGVRFLRLKFLNAYLNAIWRSAPGWPSRVACCFVLMRWVFQFSKWGSVFASFVRGSGLGGRNIARLKGRGRGEGGSPHEGVAQT
jgi:glycosyltransferase involved in cell wall biosynthesis